MQEVRDKLDTIKNAIRMGFDFGSDNDRNCYTDTVMKFHYHPNELDMAMANNRLSSVIRDMKITGKEESNMPEEVRQKRKYTRRQPATEQTTGTVAIIDQVVPTKKEAAMLQPEQTKVNLGIQIDIYVKVHTMSA